MKYRHVAPLVCLLGMAASPAPAQHGLYGSPELLQFQPPTVSAAPYAATPVSDQRLIPVAAYDYSSGNSPNVPQPPAPEGQGVVSQMLGESSATGAPAASPMGDQACSGMAAPCTGGQCEMVCEPMPTCNWFGSAAGLYMGRDKGNRLWTTYETDNEANQMMNSQDVEQDWTAGWQATIGRYFCCQQYGLAVTYWGLDNFDGYASRNALAGGTIGTPLDMRYVGFDDAGTWIDADDYFSGARAHRLWKRSEVHNVELNFIHFGNPVVACAMGYDNADVWGACNSYNPLSVNWSLGARYFRFADDLRFGSLDSDAADWSDMANQAYLSDRVVNNLIGGQVGWDVNYRLASRWSLFARPKVGIYNNHMTNRFGIARGDGLNAEIDPLSGLTGDYPIESSDDTVSFMTEIDLGMNVDLNHCCSAFFGYRLLFATGIALAEEQVPFYIVDAPEIADIDYNGDLVLHGAFAGLQFNY